MKIFCWNCRGVGNPATVHELKQLLVANALNIVFLCETKIHSNGFSRIRSICKMEGCMAINSKGKSGGIALMWKEGVKVDVQNFSNHHIDSLVTVDENEVIRFTGFYGQADPNLRSQSWDMLRRVKRTVKEGKGRRKPRKPMDEFSDILDELALIDIKTSNGCFTWSNNREGANLVKERLDRFLISKDMIKKLPFITTKVMHQSKLDYEANLLNTIGCKPGEKRCDYRSCFRYDACWAKEKEARDIITHIWADKNSDILNKMDNTREELEQYWVQRARTQWLKEGDRNTRYFHVRATGRKKNNSIDRLKDMQGAWHEDKNEICHIVWNYFHDLFRTSIAPDEDIDLSFMPKCITDDMNSFLNSEFTDDEFIRVFKQMDPRKASGIDGLSGSFFKEHWSVVGGDVLRMCRDVLKGNKNLDYINETLLVMILKIKNPCEMTHFRLISLCRVIYKIISKALANRLKVVLPQCISQNQSAFIPGRMIHDNVLVAHELMHYLRSSTNGPNKGCMIKLDMIKAYDRVEWSFLEKVMIRMGFSRENQHGKAEAFKRILHNFTRMSGQSINLDKSMVYFSPNTPTSQCMLLGDLLKMKVVDKLDGYLGLPIPAGKKRSSTFLNTLDRLASRINSWSKRLLSNGGKEVFIKSVIQAIPTYAFSVFMAPKGLLEEI
ncbi:uncharacterized protein LOC108459248 [Gossypium arboreum]|uniref:uncharacterized protein LOC108459248 n=1 Tax=Gossypium arboreum TaxID=29729 RepID=UPI0008193F77|nr:uncharacterized protein LOC108459248 [Gossypium arboreum]